MRMKRTLFSIVLLAAFAVQGLYAQATREEIFNDIATTGGVYYAYPGPSGVQTKAPKGYEPFYISHYASLLFHSYRTEVAAVSFSICPDNVQTFTDIFAQIG